MRTWNAESPVARVWGRRRLAALLSHRRGQLLVAVLFGALFGGGFVAGAIRASGPDGSAQVHSTAEQHGRGFMDGSGYDEDHQ